MKNMTEQDTISPISDKFCGTNKFGKVDRFTNYLYLSPQVLQGGAVPNDFSIDSMFPEEACISTNGNTPQAFDTSAVGGQKGSYKEIGRYTGVQLACEFPDPGYCGGLTGRTAKCYTEDLAVCLNPFPKERYINGKNIDDTTIRLSGFPYGTRSFIVDDKTLEKLQGSRNLFFISNRSELDSAFYKNALQWVYYESNLKNAKQAPYECSNNECMSDRKSTRLNSSHSDRSRMPSSA